MSGWLFAAPHARFPLITDANLPVVVIDHFRGKPWLAENFPPREGQNIRAWVNESTFLVLDTVAGFVR